VLPSGATKAIFISVAAAVVSPVTIKSKIKIGKRINFQLALSGVMLKFFSN
jgi:hypothetical protein